MAQLRAPGVVAARQGAEIDEASPAGEPAQSLRDRLRARYPVTAEALDRRDAGASRTRNAEDCPDCRNDLPYP